MVKKVFIICAVLVLVGVLVSIAGCTTPSSSPSASSAPTESSPSPTSQAKATVAAQATTLPSTPPANIQSYSGPYVGSKNSNVYHYPWCSEAKKIKADNLVVFPTLADACAAGYRPCEVCKPPACGSTPSVTPVHPTPTLIPPIPTPTPAPKPCTHVVIIIYHPSGVPCNNCASMMGTLGAYYANNPYVGISMQNATSNSVIGTVRETGQTQNLPWGYNNQIEAWIDSVLTCK